MITREYVFLFLVGTCFLLDYSSQTPLKAELQSRTKAGAMSARGGAGGKRMRAFGDVPSPEDGTRLGRRGRWKLQRNKRGWVWNQFFVLEEYMGSDPQLAATDADDPTYGNSARIVYSILHGQPYFSVDPRQQNCWVLMVQDQQINGVIRTALANMDREIKGEYQVLLQAKDMGGLLGGLASTTTINITLGDVNDNPPRFAKSIFHLRVPESASMGSAVGGIRAYDPDAGANAEVDYTIVSGEEGNMFDIISRGQSQEGIVVLKKVLLSSTVH
ncbi:hypothetical protein KUCAC02_018390 [Chaenocephalus aceratus]|uniref:Uncharacterized protein n=1 Tax=Chaenocephalus aceratus TaxID=36190 RepID=A0ACB9W932_CHAAC|nr:hypothetical protein KUCAC02_018390 [Chaenocephalus aceratus]